LVYSLFFVFSYEFLCYPAQGIPDCGRKKDYREYDRQENCPEYAGIGRRDLMRYSVGGAGNTLIPLLARARRRRAGHQCGDAGFGGDSEICDWRKTLP